MKIPICGRCGSPRDWRGVCPECALDSAFGSETAEETLNSAGRSEAYERIEELGRGGMGRVWRARQLGMNREVALKVLAWGVHADEPARERFRREASAAGRLNHPGIVAVHDFGESGGELFLAMELVEGETLAARLLRGPMPAHDSARLTRDLADAVAHAHQRGVIHRDLKPANVMLDARRNGAPRLADFGVARVLDETAAALTLSHAGIGSPAYMAPEQAGHRRAEQGPLTDVYGLGAVLYHCLTGRAPFVGESPADVARAVVELEPPSPRTFSPSIPRDIETVCLKCLEKEPRRRYASAAELRDEIDRFLSGNSLIARPVGPFGRAWRWSRRNRAAASLLGVLAIVIASGALLSETLRRRADGQRRLAEEQRKVTEINLYAADMKAADEAIQENHLAGANIGSVQTMCLIHHHGLRIASTF